MSYELFIANRYLKSKRKTGFISVITYFSIGGVTIGVAALIIVLAVMNGFETEVRTRIVGFDAHIRMRTFSETSGMENYTEIISQLKKIPHITGCAPYIIKHSILQSHNDRPQAVFVKGSDPSLEEEVSLIRKYLISGEFNFDPVAVDDSPALPGIILGSGLSSRLMAEIGGKIFLISPAGLSISGGPFQIPPVKQFRVTGIFESGLNEYDANVALCHIRDAQSLFLYGSRVDGIEIKLDNIDLADKVALEIDSMFGYPYTTETWFQRNKTLFSWMKIEKWAAFIILSLIIMVAAFNIISTLIMVVLEKTREVGILKAMGATSKSIMRIFVFEGLVIGVVGTVLGSLTGYLLCLSQLKYRWFSLPGDIYFINALPIEMKSMDFMLISGSALILCLLASIYPAWKASRLDPVEAIRYE
jgi:lipoprotein-releasing system permease protein